jgi:tetratricopeptide (TPR) repeat protein
MPEFLTSRSRDAWATIRGYVYQVDFTLLRWLSLGEGQQLQLERGEDIDIVSRDLEEILKAPAAEQERLVEQVKHRETNITLRSEIAVEAIASFIEHRKRNPDLSISFLFTTNAAAGKEKDSRMPMKLPGIIAWERVRTRELNKPTELQALNIIRALLAKAVSPPTLNADTWQGFTTYIRDATKEQFRDLVAGFQWSMEAGDAASLDQQIRQELLRQRLATDEASAQAQYERLFLYVFKLLTLSGIKTLDKKELQVQLEAVLDAKNSVLLRGITSLFGRLEVRMTALEHGQIRLEQALAKLSRPGCWIVDDKFIAEATAEASAGGPSLYERPGAARLRHIVAGQDIKRKSTGRILHAIDAQKDERKMRFVLVRSKGGNGKTTFLWRLSYELAQRGELVLVARESQRLDYDELSELCAEVEDNAARQKKRVYLLLDNVYRDHALLLKYLDQRNIPNLTVIAASRLGEFDPTAADPGSPLLDMPAIDLKGLDKSEVLQLIEHMQANDALKVGDSAEIARLSLAEEEPVIVLVARLTGAERLDTHVLERLREMNQGHDPTIMDFTSWDDFLKVYFAIARFHAWGVSVPHTVLPKLTGLSVRLVNNLLCVQSSDTLSDRAKEYLQGGCGAVGVGWSTDHELIASATVRLLGDPEHDPIGYFASTLTQLATLVENPHSKLEASSLAARLFRRCTDTPSLLFPGDEPHTALDTLPPIAEEFVITDKPSSPEHKQLAEALEEPTLAGPLNILEQAATLEEIVTYYAPGYIRVSRWQDGLRVTELGLSYSPDVPQMRAALLVLRGVVYEQLKLYHLAVADYERVLQDFPDQPDILMTRGRTLQELGRYEEAVNSYDASLRIRRNHPDTITNRGFAYSKLEQYDKALVDYDTSLRLRPNDANTLTNKGVTLTHLDKFAKALEVHTQAIEADPQHARALSNRGITLYHRGVTHKLAGRKEEAQRDFDASLRDLERSLDLKSEDPEALTARGNTRSELGMTPAAMQDYKDALTVRPNDPIALHNLGHMHSSIGEHDDAETCFNASLLARPGHAHTLTNRAMNRHAMGRYADAATDYELAVDILMKQTRNRENQEMLYKVHFHFGVTRYIQLKFDSALEHFDAAFEHFTVALEKEMIEHEGTRLPLLAWRGLALAHVGRTDEATADLVRMSERYPDEPYAHYAWACFYCLQGDNNRALAELARAIAGDIHFRKIARTDADFAKLKSNPQFMALIE